MLSKVRYNLQLIIDSNKKGVDSNYKIIERRGAAIK
jgi:hypothetical protein